MNKLSELIEEFLRYLLIDKGYSNNTIESYKRDLDKFLETHYVKQIFIRGDTEADINNTYMDIIKLNDVKVVNESSYFHTGIIEKKGLWFSVGHADVNKGTAIIKLCQHLGVELANT